MIGRAVILPHVISWVSSSWIKDSWNASFEIIGALKYKKCFDPENMYRWIMKLKQNNRAGQTLVTTKGWKNITVNFRNYIYMCALG